MLTSHSQKILAGKPIKVFNHGKMERDFTYINDIVGGIVKLIDKAPVTNKEWEESKDGLRSRFAPYKIYMDMQSGDVLRTNEDVSELEKDINFKPSTCIEDGLLKFVEWDPEYYRVENQIK